LPLQRDLAVPVIEAQLDHPDQPAMTADPEWIWMKENPANQESRRNSTMTLRTYWLRTAPAQRPPVTRALPALRAHPDQPVKTGRPVRTEKPVITALGERREKAVMPVRPGQKVQLVTTAQSYRQKTCRPDPPVVLEKRVATADPVRPERPVQPDLTDLPAARVTPVQLAKTDRLVGPANPVPRANPDPRAPVPTAHHPALLPAISLTAMMISAICASLHSPLNSAGGG
jgi:hypothetical protein